MALSIDGATFAITWSYEDASDPYAACSGAIDLWNVAARARTETITGIPGGLANIDPGGRDHLQWFADGTLGFVFNTNAVGRLDPNRRVIVEGVGDPTGTDTGQAWYRVDDDHWIVGFHADYRDLGRLPPVSVWRPRDKALAQLNAPGLPDDGFGRYQAAGDGRIVGIRGDALTLLDIHADRVIARVPQADRSMKRRFDGPQFPPGLVGYAQHARSHVSPNARWIVSDEQDGLWLRAGTDFGQVHHLAARSPDRVPGAFAWSADGAWLAVSMRSSRRAIGEVVWFETATGARRGVAEGAARSGASADVLYASYAQPIAIDGDGRLAVLRDRTVTLLELPDGRILGELAVPPETLALAFGDRGTLVAAGAGNVHMAAQ